MPPRSKKSKKKTKKKTARKPRTQSTRGWRAEPGHVQELPATETPKGDAGKTLVFSIRINSTLLEQIRYWAEFEAQRTEVTLTQPVAINKLIRIGLRTAYAQMNEYLEKQKRQMDESED